MRLLLIDNYDSFTFNLYQLIGSIPNVEIEIYRNDEINLKRISEMQFDGIILSPGPGNPANQRDFGICTDIITELKGKLPILGVCLGHQGMGLLLNGRIIQAERILHGKTSIISHDQQGLFESIPNNIKVARYHSLIIDRTDFPSQLIITAETEMGEIMAIRHIEYPLFGVQFHPESFMTEYGLEMIENFVKIVLSHSKLSKSILEVK